MQSDTIIKSKLEIIKNDLMEKYGHIDVLINNAANNPKVEGGAANLGATKFIDFPLDTWNDDIMVMILVTFGQRSCNTRTNILITFGQTFY